MSVSLSVTVPSPVPDPVVEDNDKESPEEPIALETTQTERNGLLEACLAWQPGRKPLEELLAAQVFLQADPVKNLKLVRLLQDILDLHRRSQNKQADNKGDED